MHAVDLGDARLVRTLLVDVDRQLPAYAEEPDPARDGPSDLVDLSWAPQHGNRWIQARRGAHASDLFDGLRPWI